MTDQAKAEARADQWWVTQQGRISFVHGLALVSRRDITNLILSVQDETSRRGRPVWRAVGKADRDAEVALVVDKVFTDATETSNMEDAIKGILDAVHEELERRLGLEKLGDFVNWRCEDSLEHSCVQDDGTP